MSDWPELEWQDFQETAATLQRWTQIVGKIRLVQAPWINHSWGVALYVTARGLTSSPMPYGQRTFQIDFDFIDHQLVISTAEGERRAIELRPRSVADLHTELFAALDKLGLSITIDPRPNEVEDATPLDRDHAHASYDRDQASRFWRILLHSERVMQRFRSKFIGKCSPVHFFWGSFDLAVTRFSGRAAPPHPGGIPHLPDEVTREAYSHEVSSAGFWPGGGPVAHPAYYSYAYPAPAGFESAHVRPDSAFFHDTLREFILPYEHVRASSSPDEVLLEFFQSTYEAAAGLANWDRAGLEREFDPTGRKRRPRSSASR